MTDSKIIIEILNVLYLHEVTENVIISLEKLYNGYIGWSDVSLIILSNMRGGAERRDLLKMAIVNLKTTKIIEV
ncbi:hypothetical protein TSAR_011655 [Trichomalopsis sarcophagae]|uniref:Uncharacterized protein n=1 Tax=Trichomalopsis sarcophagae TaxID=543379 RepID=A0A232EH46_9HYME|nr:hypothetical protein TSAR_011655 [Trichomalopsis sarcophagae]